MNGKSEDMNKEDYVEEEVDEELGEENEGSDSDLIKAKDDEIDDLKAKLSRLQADFVNFKRRAEKEKENSIDYGIESIASDLLPVLDDFQRALDSEVDKEDSFYKGISLVEQKLIGMLDKNEIKEIDSLGEEFDPNFHHAVVMEESDEYEAGKIINVLQKGYTLKDKVLRPSMVIVSK